MNTTSSARDLKRAKQWKTAFIALSVAWPICFIIGGALYGSAESCVLAHTYIDEYGDVYAGNYTACVGEAIAGIVFLCLGGVTFIAWVVLLVLRFTSWYPKTATTSSISHPTEYSQHNTTTTAPVTAEPKTDPTITTTQPTPTHLCSTCEHPINGNFCENCGTKTQ